MFAAAKLFDYFRSGFSGGDVFLENVKKNLKSGLDLKEKQMSMLASPGSLKIEVLKSKNLELKCKFASEYTVTFPS